MKKLNWLLVLLIILCCAVFVGYNAYENMKTDAVAPEIHMGEQIPEISVADPKSALLQDITATDNKDGDVTASLVVENVSLLDNNGRLLVKYAAFDRAGNVAKAEREAQYTDYESPRLILDGPLLYPANISFDVLETVGAVDVIDGDIQHRVRATAQEEYSISEEGTHAVKFQVTNSLGETVSRIFPVEVYQSEMYEADLELTDYLVYLQTGDEFDPENYLDCFILKGDEISLRYGLPEDYALKVSGTVHTRIPGTYAVKYRVTYSEYDSRNPDKDRQYVAYSKLIVVVEGEIDG